jgi:WD40 repeat protein
VVVAVGGWTGGNWDGEHSIYLFDRADGRLLRRLPGSPDVIHHLAFSPDGRWLAASLGGKNGVRVFKAQTGAETGRDADYGAESYSAHFSPDSRRLLTTSFDGVLRLYALQEGKLDPLKRARPSGGKQPYSARFSPDGRFIAVGFYDSTVVQVLDVQTLAEVARPSTIGVDNGDLGNVAWSADGRYLLLGGRWQVGGKSPVRRWPVGEWSRYEDLPLTINTIQDLVPLPGGGVLFAASGPAWGVIDPAFKVQQRHGGEIADLRNQRSIFGLSADARRVRFGYEQWGKDARSFDVTSRSLGRDAPEFAAARISAEGLDISNWQDKFDPSLNGQALELKPYETSRSLAIAPDDQRFVLGTEWSLRLFDRSGKQLWQQAVPAVAWAVNWSADGRYIVAGYADGTIRWHRASDGAELLAFFPHADRKRWIAWTPEGFYATSGPEAEELMGHHLNRGKEREGEFVSTRQLREHFYQPGLISRRLDADGDVLVADAVKKLGDVQQLLAGAKALPPVVELLSDTEVTTDSEVTVKVRVKDRGGGVGQLIYRIDDVELQGRIAGPMGADGTESRSFTLPQGPRAITVTASNAKGVESNAVRVVVNVRPKQQAAPALYVLAVGVTHYRDKELEKGVRFAAADAETVGNLFREQGQRLYRTVNTRVLTEQQANGDGIRKALEELAGQIAAQDVFVLYLAGHGASFDRDYHFIPWDAIYSSSNKLRERSVTNQQFRELLAKIAATKTVILLDTCSSGGFGRQEGRGVSDKDSIDRLSRLTGRAMIAATADEKMAIEGEGGHGAFTFALLEGLSGKADRNNNGSVEVRELADYVEERLPEITRKWGYEQFPFSSTEGASFSLVNKP